MAKRRTGVTVILPGGTRVRFPKCQYIKPETAFGGEVIRTRLSKRDGEDRYLLGYAPPGAVIQVHWNE